MNEWLMVLPEDEATFWARVALAFVFCFGAIIGSFLNVCIYRIPLDQSVSVPRSHCFGCGKTIPWYFNIPLLSWFMLRGKCAYCKSPISFRYPAVEALTALLFLLVFQMWGNPTLFGLVKLQEPLLIPIYWLFVASVIVDAFIDLDHGILLDRIAYGGTFLALVMSALFPEIHGQAVWTQGLLQSGIGIAVGFGGLFAIAWLGELVFRKEAMGFGDVKWMALFGALFGWNGCLAILIVASLLGALVGIVLMLSRRAQMTSAIPFGPYLGAGALLWLFWGTRMWDWYIALLMPAQ
ncbi:MAG: prepilin peptidase [Kiritimatiellia bacterium]